MSNYIYADNAATTQLDITAFEAMRPYLLELYGNPSQPYSFSRTARNAIQESRNIIADCIGAMPEEIYFTSGGSESDNWAISTIREQSVEKRNIIISEIEHHAIVNSCENLKNYGVNIFYLKPNREGTLSAKELEKLLSTNAVGLVSIMTANNEIGTIEPIKELCEVAHRHNAIFHTDAVQAIGHVNIDVRKLGVDMLSASAHKFNGPKGIGFLYIKKGTTVPSFIYGGSQEHRLRAGTENVAAIVGMAHALKENCIAIEENQRKIRGLENQLLSALRESGKAFIVNGSSHKLPGLLSLSFADKDGEAILHRMDLMKIAISTGSACDSKRTTISHVLKSICLDEKYAKGTIRISLGKNNNSDEIDAIANALNKIL